MRGRVGSCVQPDGAAGRGDVSVSIDGAVLPARRGSSVLAALFAHGHVAVSKDLAGRISGAFCGMGVCFACNVIVDGAKRRACAVTVRDGMSIRTCTNLAELLAERRAAALTDGADGGR